jgi:hypothetical protein
LRRAGGLLWWSFSGGSWWVTSADPFSVFQLGPERLVLALKVDEAPEQPLTLSGCDSLRSL